MDKQVSSKHWCHKIISMKYILPHNLLITLLPSQTFLLYFHACPFCSSCFLTSAHCQSGSVRFLGVVLPFPHSTHSQQPQCCSRLVHVISNPLQLEWATVGMKQGQQTASLPGKSDPFPLLTHHKTVGTSGLECKQNTPWPPRRCRATRHGDQHTVVMAGKYNGCLVCRVGMWFDTHFLFSPTQTDTSQTSWLREFIIEPVWLNQIHTGFYFSFPFFFLLSPWLHSYTTPTYHKISIPDKQDFSLSVAGRSRHN